jgi:glyoxylase-like metal-dependent hydrolase (beta-lactamase superfamily II)
MAVKKISQILVEPVEIPLGWGASAVVNDDNMSYLAWSEASRELVVVDPMREDWDELLAELKNFAGYRVIAVIDTHTHADHVSCAAKLGEKLKAPVVMHAQAPSKRVDLRIGRDSSLSTAAGPMQFIQSPGHTPDCVCVVWGPWFFVGDVLMFGDTGRNDLPGGDPAAHYETLQKLKKLVSPESLVLFGHDEKGGRVVRWSHQLKNNSSVTQNRESFIADASAFNGPSPKALKESLFENTK